MDSDILNSYIDGLLSSFSKATATSLSSALDGFYSHDAITRFLAQSDLASKNFWHQVKPIAREIESDSGVIAIDDTISEKPSMDENEIVAWYYDHAKGRAVKGINIITALYHSRGISLPVAFTIVKKTKYIRDPKTKKEKRVSQETKNDHCRTMLAHCYKNIKFAYVLADIWYASVETMTFIVQRLQKNFIFPLKSNRKVALSASDQRAGTYVTVNTLRFKGEEPITAYLEGLQFPVVLIRHVYKNDDGSEGILYLCTSDVTLTHGQMIDLYQKRWKIEEYHKALKQECALSESPAHTARTQSAHIFCSLCAFVKLELLRNVVHTTYHGLKHMLHQQAMKASLALLRNLTIWRHMPKLRFA
jgi:hypothetical protein